jgi:hypothetical protein
MQAGFAAERRLAGRLAAGQQRMHAAHAGRLTSGAGPAGRCTFSTSTSRGA